MSWDRIQEALACDVRACDIEEIKRCVESGAYQLWESENSSMLTHGINLASGGIGVNVVAAAGDLQEIVGLLTQVEQEARASGVELLTTTGRNGWKPTARLLGWDHVASIYTKRLD